MADAPLPKVIRARSYVGRAAKSASSPHKYLCGPAQETYCIKFRNNDHGDGKALVAEHVAGRCGKLLVAPVGDARLVEVSDHLTTGVTLRDEVTPVASGVHHATKWMNDYSDLAGIQNVDENRQALGALQVLYTWLMCTGDHQLIYSNSSPRAVASVDHTQFLPGGAGGWTSDELRAQAQHVAIDSFFDQAALTNVDRKPALRALARIHDNDVARVVVGPPQPWGIDTTDRIALAEFLWTRRDAVLGLWPETNK